MAIAGDAGPYGTEDEDPAPRPREDDGYGWWHHSGGRTYPKTVLGANAVLASLAFVKLAVHLLTAQNYGYFRNELYYVAAGERLAFGYVDFPPFVALVAAFARATLGDSLLALRLFPALAGAAVVVTAGLMARELGGGRCAQEPSPALADGPKRAQPLGVWRKSGYLSIYENQRCWVGSAP